MIIGTHIIVDMYNINNTIFEKVSKKNYNLFNDLIEEIIKKNGATLLNKNVHHFNDNGGKICESKSKLLTNPSFVLRSAGLIELTIIKRFIAVFLSKFILLLVNK